ncbi:uncharacterized protein M421DRAFT_300250 [Didymella exigua CBS 183.55]|uniref:Uncharacterized protein n=1 Tax=Didymella exigua CBS 183.55 TaxID=1150837 RepID=A0A6A5RA05_9PLEO|nr:uncharacterized protein M421DRAFT_300250 [Didymella exigua CBS 183.55]KAF1924038.1 hypothetical protein M421DRAFT_300250 [Didymella exigua CBS 183.55]
MSVDKVSVNKISVNTMSVNTMSVNTMSVNTMSVNTMSVNQMSVNTKCPSTRASQYPVSIVSTWLRFHCFKVVAASTTPQTAMLRVEEETGGGRCVTKSGTVTSLDKDQTSTLLFTSDGSDEKGIPHARGRSGVCSVVRVSE